METKLHFKRISAEKIKALVLIILFFNGISSLAQQDTCYKNTIHINVTNPMIFGNKSIILGYERILKNNKSFSVNFGRTSYPKMISFNTDLPGIDLKKSYQDKGFNFSADYRFYLKKENKYAAPRGVYIGPYYSFNYFNRVNNWALNTNDFQGDLQTDMTINIHTAGIELGYQFVLWNRMSVDMVLIGPGVSFYSLKAKLDTSLNADDESMFFEELNNFFSDKFPGYDLVIDGEEFKTSGSVKTTSLGYRYMIMIGYRF